MEQLTYVHDELHYHWFELNNHGWIAHTIHQLNRPPLHAVWKLASKVKQFRMIAAAQTLHLVALTDAGLYYVKSDLSEQIQQEVRIEPSSMIEAPYICRFQDDLYICYMKQQEEALVLVLRTFREGIWYERVHLLLSTLRQDEVVHLKQTEYRLGDDGVLHGLAVLACEITGTDCMYYMKLQLAGGEVTWQRMMETKISEQPWKLALYLGKPGALHACWVVSHKSNVLMYYKNVKDDQSPVSRYISFDKELPIPYYLTHQGMLILMFVYTSGKILHTRSWTSGERWSPYTELLDVNTKQLKFVQSVSAQGEGIAPIQLLGVGEPYLRPATWQDIENPFLTPPESMSFEQLKMGVKHMMNLMDSHVIRFVMQLHDELQLLAARRSQLLQATAQLHAHTLQLEAEENEIMLQMVLNKEEPFSDRHIQ